MFLVIVHISSRLGSHAQSSDGVGTVAADLWVITSDVRVVHPAGYVIMGPSLSKELVNAV